MFFVRTEIDPNGRSELKTMDNMICHHHIIRYCIDLHHYIHHYIHYYIHYYMHIYYVYMHILCIYCNPEQRPQAAGAAAAGSALDDVLVLAFEL